MQWYLWLVLIWAVLGIVLMGWWILYWQYQHSWDESDRVRRREETEQRKDPPDHP